MSLGIPIKLLHESEGHIVTIQLKNGETYRGKLELAEDNMNILLMGDITKTHRDGSTEPLDQAFIRGSHIRFVVIPDILKDAPMFRKDLVKAARLVGQSEAEDPVQRARTHARKTTGFGRQGMPRR